MSTTGKAQPGQYDVSIERLAKNQTLSGKGVADGKTSMGNSNAERTVSIKIGDGSDAKKNFDIKLSSDKTSPIEVADAINKADKGVSASVVKDKQGEYHLVLISKTQGPILLSVFLLPAMMIWIKPSAENQKNKPTVPLNLSVTAA